MGKRRIRDGEKGGLGLSHAEQTALLERVPSLPKRVREAILATLPSRSVMLTLDDLRDLAGHVVAGASRAGDQKVKKALDRISTKIEKLLDEYPQESRLEAGGMSDILAFPAERSAGQRRRSCQWHRGRRGAARDTRSR